MFDTQEPEDLKLYSDAVPKLVNAGMRIPQTWAHDKLKIPQAQKDEAVLTPTVAASGGPIEPPTSGNRSRPSPQRAGQAEAQDELDELADAMLGEWEDALGELVQPALDAAANAGSLEEFRAVLEDQLAEIEPAKLAKLLATGQFGARAWGQLNLRSPDDRAGA